LRRMENMFAGVIYQNAHGGAPAAYAPPQQYAALPQQYATPPRQYAAPATTAIFCPATAKLHCFRRPHLRGPAPRTEVPFQRVF
jgi:hypothetical protein